MTLVGEVYDEKSVTIGTSDGFARLIPVKTSLCVISRYYSIVDQAIYANIFVFC